MRIFKSIQEFNEARDALGKLSFVPTMGNLHKGHTSLVDIAKQFKNKIIASANDACIVLDSDVSKFVI